MLYLFTGDDTKNKNLNYEKFIKSFPSAIPIFPINRNNFIKDQIESFYSGSSLFFLKCIVVFDGILDRQENEEEDEINDEQNVYSKNYIIKIYAPNNPSPNNLFKIE